MKSDDYFKAQYVSSTVLGTDLHYHLGSEAAVPERWLLRALCEQLKSNEQNILVKKTDNGEQTALAELQYPIITWWVSTSRCIRLVDCCGVNYVPSKLVLKPWPTIWWFLYLGYLGVNFRWLGHWELKLSDVYQESVSFCLQFHILIDHMRFLFCT